MDQFYPPGPETVPQDIARPSGQYARQAWLALLTLAGFLVLYLVLVWWFAHTAYRLFVASIAGSENTVINCVIGGCAVFLTVFMLKALFFVKRGGTPNVVEVTAMELPGLFTFLNRLADDAGAPRPARVYLSARVNASVFYDISLLNLFFPSRKNLEIGLPLVNVLTLSEMKAVLAHEFGHFAQRSMAIGSWVYIAHQIAAHLVAKRDGLDTFLQRLSRSDIRFAWVGWLLSVIVWSIRSLVDSLFNLVLLAQRALSRQMEFQADLVAVSLTGSDELVHALHKLKAADQAWTNAVNLGLKELNQKRRTEDLFEMQLRIIARVGEILDDENYGRVPKTLDVPPGEHRVFVTNFAQPPQMWASHPANADRETNAKQRYVSAIHDSRSAWVLFDQIGTLKSKVMAHFFAKHETVLASPEQTEQAFDAIYGLMQYHTRFRGSYLNRPLTRHAADPVELYRGGLEHGDLQHALGALYPASLSQEVVRLRDLEEELGLLRAIHEKRLKTSGDSVMYRGRSIKRRDLSAAITEVDAEAQHLRERIQAHDAQCRVAHLARAEQLGHGWRDYLIGLIEILHYAEHTLADLIDARGQLGNVLAVMTANRRVRDGELPRLLETANMLHRVLEQIYERKTQVQLDALLLARLNVSHWSALLQDFKLEGAQKSNINNWMKVIDGWVNSAANALSLLSRVALEQLLVTENQVAHPSGEIVESAPTPSQAPSTYARLLPGRERKRQMQLEWWDRFRVADGLVPALGRFLVAGGIVGGVLGFSSIAATTNSLSIYNGLGRPVVVTLGGQHVPVPAYSAATVDIPVAGVRFVETDTTDGRLIERLTLVSREHYGHLVYNVAAASPLVTWTAVYGNYPKTEPRFLSNPVWLDGNADVYFTKPPSSISTSAGGGGSRTVLSGLGNAQPETQLRLVKEPSDQQKLIMAHATWDLASTPDVAQWQALASGVKAN